VDEPGDLFAVLWLHFVRARRWLRAGAAEEVVYLISQRVVLVESTGRRWQTITLPIFRRRTPRCIAPFVSHERTSQSRHSPGGIALSVSRGYTSPSHHNPQYIQLFVVRVCRWPIDGRQQDDEIRKLLPVELRTDSLPQLNVLPPS